MSGPQGRAARVTPRTTGDALLLRYYAGAAFSLTPKGRAALAASSLETAEETEETEETERQQQAAGGAA